MVQSLTPKTFSRRRAFLIILIGIALPVLVYYQLGLPIRQWASERFVQRGDVQFRVRQYESAESEYRRALRVYAENERAQDRLRIVLAAPTDPRVARDFFAAGGVDNMVRLIDEATATVVSPKAGLQKAIDLYAIGEYALARYPIEQAITLDPAYPEAWNQAYLIYEQLAGLDAQYRVKAEEAKERRDELSPRWLE